VTVASIEVIRDGSPEMVWASDIVHVPDSELETAKAAFDKTGVCTCNTKRRFVVDAPGMPYDIRSCAVCGAHLGYV
jgi:hypothetical protein